MKRLSLSLAFTLVAAAFLAPLCSGKDKKKDPNEIGNRDVGKGINLYSLDKEIAMGKQLATEVARQAKLVNDPIVSEYVNRVGQNLVRNSDVTMPVTIQIIDDEALNAFTLPGGFVFVNSGLIRAAESEAELAGAMAHELAHVAARHATRQESRAQIVSMASLPLILLGGWTGYAIRQGANIGIPMQFLRFSRGFESEADMLGLQYMYKAGYDPVASIDIFERLESLEKRKPGVMAKVFSTHPMTEDRIKNVQKNIADLPAKPEYVVNTSEFDQMRARLNVMHNRRKRDTQDPNRPVLRRGPGAGTGTIDGDTGDARKNDDDRPVLKRREDLY